MSSDEVRNAICNEDFKSEGEDIKEKAGDIEVNRGLQEENKWLRAEKARLVKELKAALAPLIKLKKGPHEEGKPINPIFMCRLYTVEVGIRIMLQINSLL